MKIQKITKFLEITTKFIKKIKSIKNTSIFRKSPIRFPTRRRRGFLEWGGDWGGGDNGLTDRPKVGFPCFWGVVGVLGIVDLTRSCFLWTP